MPRSAHSPARLLTLATVAALAAGCAGSNAPATFVAAPSASVPASAAATASSPAPSAPVPGGSAASPSGGASASASASSTGGPSSASVIPAPGGPNLEALHVALAPVVSGLHAPVFVAGSGDGSGRLFVLEQPGTIRVVAGGQLLPTPYLDLTAKIASGGERGLLGLAFAPGFGKTDQRLYVHYSNLDGNTTIAELKTAPDGTSADPATERILLVEQQPYANHNGGWIGFDAKGRLLIGLGDGGSGGDPENRASNLATILGKMLRIDVLAGPSDGRQYAIPADNPFLATTGARPEILDFGLRNPYRDSVDPATGTLWIGDVGQSAWEEVDRAPADAAGLDFGWRRWEGRHCYSPSTGCDPAGVTMPVAEYGHDQGCAIVGGVVYRGAAIPALDGAYLFGDYCSGTLWAIDAAGPAKQQPVKLLATGLSISSISTGDDGEVVLTDLKGTLQRLVAAG